MTQSIYERDREAPTAPKPGCEAAPQALVAGDAHGIRGPPRRILSIKEVATRRGCSPSTVRRDLKRDPDSPKLVHYGVNRVGIIEHHENIYQELLWLRRLYFIDCKPVWPKIEACRAIIHGTDKIDAAA